MSTLHIEYNAGPLDVDVDTDGDQNGWQETDDLADGQPNAELQNVGLLAAGIRNEHLDQQSQAADFTEEERLLNAELARLKAVGPVLTLSSQRINEEAVCSWAC